MQVIDPKKRSNILKAAAELFATQPFHKVLLSEVAEAAGVGKGTLYIYFKDKNDLYLSVVYNGYSQLIDRLRQKVDENRNSALVNLEAAVGEIVTFAYQNPHVFELMRTMPWRKVTDSAKWSPKRSELKGVIEAIIRKGIQRGEFVDPHPELTARFIPNLVRSVMMEGTQYVDEHTLTAHILRFTRFALMAQRPKDIGLSHEYF